MPWASESLKQWAASQTLSSYQWMIQSHTPSYQQLFSSPQLTLLKLCRSCVAFCTRPFYDTRKQIAVHKKWKSTYSSLQFYVPSLSDSKMNTLRINLTKMSLCQFHVRWPIPRREARQILNNITNQIVWGFQSTIAKDMTSVQLRVPSLRVHLYSSEQGKSETLRLELRITSNEILCANCISKLGCLSNNMNNYYSEAHHTFTAKLLGFKCKEDPRSS